MKTIIFLAMIVLLAACSKEKMMEQTGTVAVTSCKEITTGKGTLTYCFDSVIVDARCPVNMVCVWQGYAAARFIFSKNDEIKTVTMMPAPGVGVDKIYPTTVEVFGYQVRFIDLSQYPGLEPENYLKYNATLSISEN
ncbi:MAG: hypothetical protein Q7T76_03160 [Ferruginibacter sp.]|nr:hypothetical protein [Ferruginibacter sp.]